MAYDLDSVDGWNAAQCEECMLTLNCEQRNDVAANLEFYREHCRCLITDNHEGLARDTAIELSVRNPRLSVQVYQWPWGSFCHRFETTIQTSLDGYPVRHVATYRS